MKTPFRLIIILLGTLSLAGCVTYFASAFVRVLLQTIATEGVQAAAQYVEAEMKLVADDGQLLEVRPVSMLQHLEAGQLWRAAGDLQRSNDHFDVAEFFFGDEDTKDALVATYDVIAKTFGDDGSYAANPYERVLVNFFKAINYWSRADISAARVEFNRSHERTQIAVEGYQKELQELKDAIETDEDVDYDDKDYDELIARHYPDYRSWKIYHGYVNPAVLFLHAQFLKSGDGSDRSQAESFLQRVYGILPDNPVVEQELKQLISGADQTAHITTLVFESGISSGLRQEKIEFPVSWQNNFVLISTALPRIDPTTKVDVSANIQYVSANDGERRAPTFYQLTDSLRLMQTEMQHRMPVILLQAISETMLKAGSQIAINELTKDTVFSGLINLLVSTTLSATTSSDTRKWITTPSTWQVAHIPNHEIRDLQLTIPHANGNKPQVLNISADEDNLIYIKQMNQTSKPIVRTLKGQ